MTKQPSVEPQVADMVNGWMKDYGLDYRLEQQPLNHEIDTALDEYFSKSGGTGGNRPDAKLLLRGSDGRDYPILIEYKGYKGKLVKLDSDGQVENQTAKNEPNYKNIKEYAVNGAVHYANALLHYTAYTEILAIGVTGWIDAQGNLAHQIGVYEVSKSSFGMGQLVGEYDDLSFLKKGNFDAFLEHVKHLSLTPEELAAIRAKRDQEIHISLAHLNNDIYQNEKGLTESDRVYLVVASIMATLGVPQKNVPPLEKSDLRSSSEPDNTDGEILMRKVKNFLRARNLPQEKRDSILRTLANTILSERLNRVENGETQLRRVFVKIVDDLGIYYKIGLTTDFTGKLFNEMYGWFGFTQDKLNDVVLTPPYVAELLVKLARTNKDSYVWDNATGSAGLLVAAMNEMLRDAKQTMHSPAALQQKEFQIRANQLLGLEILPSIYMLAVLNMILMGDGSSHVLNMDSLQDFDGMYQKIQADGTQISVEFPADVFVLNPPYSAPGKGMVFVSSALSRMKRGYAAVIIQSSAGSGKAVAYNREILQHNTLLASIKMPADLFVGKSNVQTNIYVFRIGERHEKDSVVKFIDFSNDGYTRSNRRKAHKNLRDTDHAKERYEEVVQLVKFGKKKMHYFTEREYYEGTIEPENGADWNQSTPIDSRADENDFRKTVKDYLLWEVSSAIWRGPRDAACAPSGADGTDGGWKSYKVGELFRIEGNPQLNKDAFHFSETGKYPYFTRTIMNNGIAGYVDYLDDAHKIPGGCLAVGMMGMQFFYMAQDFYAGQFTKRLIPRDFELNAQRAIYFTSILNKYQSMLQDKLVREFETTCASISIKLPVNETGIDFARMEQQVKRLEVEQLHLLQQYVKDKLREKSVR